MTVQCSPKIKARLFCSRMPTSNAMASAMTDAEAEYSMYLLKHAVRVSGVSCGRGACRGFDTHRHGAHAASSAPQIHASHADIDPTMTNARWKPALSRKKEPVSQSKRTGLPLSTSHTSYPSAPDEFHWLRRRTMCTSMSSPLQFALSRGNVPPHAVRVSNAATA